MLLTANVPVETNNHTQSSIQIKPVAGTIFICSLQLLQENLRQTWSNVFWHDFNKIIQSIQFGRLGTRFIYLFTFSVNVWQKINKDAVYTLQNIGWLNKGVATFIFYNLLVIYFVGFCHYYCCCYNKNWVVWLMPKASPCVCAGALWKTRGAHWRNSMMVTNRRVITHRGKGFHSTWRRFWLRESVYVRVWV